LLSGGKFKTINNKKSLIIKLKTNMDKDKTIPTLSKTAVNGSFSYDDFIIKLKELGFEIKVVGYNDRDFRFSLEMNGFRVSGEDYPVFGRYCAGNYNSCGRSEQNEFSQIDI
jgi:hypothetical protein